MIRRAALDVTRTHPQRADRWSRLPGVTAATRYPDYRPGVDHAALRAGTKLAGLARKDRPDGHSFGFGIGSLEPLKHGGAIRSALDSQRLFVPRGRRVSRLKKDATDSSDFAVTLRSN